MNKWTFKPIDRDTPRFPACVQDYLPEVHVARFVVEVVEMIDFTAFTSTYKGTGSKAWHPPFLMLSLLFYGYTTGVFLYAGWRKQHVTSSCDFIAFRYICANEHPDHDSINTFRRRFRQEISELFVQILMIAKQAGWLKMGAVSLDGTKIAGKTAQGRS